MVLAEAPSSAGPELWVGSQSLEEYEEQLLASLQRDLRGIEGDTLILGGFYVGRHQFDALVLRNKGIYVIEAKNIRCPVHITENTTFRRGPDGSDGDPYEIGFKNQCYSQFYALVDWFRDNGDYVLGSQKAIRIVWKSNQFLAPGQVLWKIQLILLFWPQMHPDTVVELDERRVKAFGYTEAVEYIKKHSCAGVSLSLEEMRRMARKLSLRPAPSAISLATPAHDGAAGPGLRRPEQDQRNIEPEPPRHEQGQLESGQEPPAGSQEVKRPPEATVGREAGRPSSPHRGSRRLERRRRWWTGWAAAIRAAQYAFRLRLAREHLARERESARRELARIERLERKLSSLTRRPRAA
jgi:hypothetical protein